IRTLHQLETVGRQGRRGQIAGALSDRRRGADQDADRAGRLGGAHPPAVLCRGPGDRYRDWNGVPAKGHLVICNRQYIDMFGVSPEIAKPGCHLRDLILHRQKLGSFVGDVDAYCAKFLDPKLGVQDIVTSTPDGRTIRLISKRSPGGGWATTMEDVTEGSRVQAKMEHLAHYAALPNLPNRTLFQRHAEKLLLEAESVEFSILYIDIYEYKRINDTPRHLIGDEFLKGVADRLRQSTGTGDFIARLGGDEFAILQ